MSDIDTLRKAAALMRELAEAATPGPWDWNGYAPDQYEVWQDEEVEDYAQVASVAEKADATHIAYWSPDVALTIADLLDREADVLARELARLVAAFGDDKADDFLAGSNAVAVARAFLGGAA